MSALKLFAGPAEYPVTLERAKRFLRIEDSVTDDDDLIEGFIEAATIYAEKFTGLALIDQTWDYYLDAFPTAEFEIPRPPLIEVVGVFYTDSDSIEQEFTGFSVDDSSSSSPARLYLPTGSSWPTLTSAPGSVRIRFRAGYLDQGVSPAVANVPASIKSAIMIYMSTLYEFREVSVAGSLQEVPYSAEEILRMHRIEKGMA